MTVVICEPHHIRPTISQADLERILKLALRAPSGDNCQPYRFVWDGDKLEVRYCEQRGDHFIDVLKVGTLLALGGLIEHLELAGSLYGCRVAYVIEARTLNYVDDELLATISFAKDPSIQPRRLAPQVEERYTDRRPYKPSDELWHAVQGSTLLALNGVISKGSKRLSKLLMKGDRILWTVKDAQQGLMKWLRLTDKAVAQHDDGLDYQALGVSGFERLTLMVLRVWAVQWVMNKLGGLLMMSRATKRLADSATGFVVVTADARTPKALVEAGRRGMRSWLELTRLGCAVQPMSLIPFFTFARNIGYQVDDRINRFEFLDSAEQVMRDEFDLNDQQVPVWILRFGKAPAEPPRRSKRIDVNKILQTKNSSPVNWGGAA